MTAKTTRNLVLQRQKFNDNFTVSNLYKLPLGSSKVRWKIIFYSTGGVYHPSHQHSEIIIPVCFRVPFTNSHSPTTCFSDLGNKAMLPKS